MTELLIDAEASATRIAISAVVHHVGNDYFQRCVNTAVREHLKAGVFGWKPSVGNMLFETCPAPEPWRGQWAYRLRLTAPCADNSVNVIEFWLPQSDISLALKGNLKDN